MVGLLLALATLKILGELHALSMNEHLCKLLPEEAGMVLRLNPAFLPKVLVPSQPGQDITVWSFFSESEEGDRQRSLV